MKALLVLTSITIIISLLFISGQFALGLLLLAVVILYGINDSF